MLPSCILSLSHARAALHDNDSTQIIFLEIKREKIALIEFLHTKKITAQFSLCRNVFMFFDLFNACLKEFHQFFFSAASSSAASL